MPTQPVDRKILEREVAQWNGGLCKLTVTEAAAKLDMPRERLRHHLKLARQAGIEVAEPANPLSLIGAHKGANGHAGRSLDEFRAEHDKAFIVPGRIREALEKLGDGWLYEMEFAKLAGVSLADLGNFRSMFEAHIVAIRRDGGKRAWASKATAAKMREMLS